MDLLEMVEDHRIDAPVVVLSSLTSTRETIQALRKGAFDFIQKPFSLPELEIKVARAIQTRRLEREAQDLRGERRNLIYLTDNFIGESAEIRKVLRIVNKVAQTSSSIILRGETGTGKELIAGAIHYGSPRANGPYVRVNCAALPEQLLESELFGHENGAFTGASGRRIGRFEMADGGTIFLDEIADMSLSTQAKVLRVLQGKEFERLGSSKTIKVDVRVVSATNKDLGRGRRTGQFREDLYYRLNVLTIQIPPLRERGNDILLLAQYFLRKISGDLKKKIKSIHPQALRMLSAYHWPGNIRELENTIERAVIMTEGDVITREDLNLPFKMESEKWDSNSIEIPPSGINLEEVERELILKALKMKGWVQKDAAELVGISRRVLNYKIKRFGITHPKWKRNI
jgi:DNA-binding NtrC family response regulator